MVDTEGRSGGGVERGSGGEPVENLKVDESRLVSVSRDKVERKQLIDRWDKNLTKSKDLFKEKLVGGKQEHKRELNKIIGESKAELRKIQEMSPEKQAEAYKKLEEKSERRLEKLVREVGNEAGEMKDGQVGRMAGKENQTKLVWQKWQEVEEAKDKFKRELDSGRSSESSLSEAQRNLINKQTELNSLMGEVGEDYKNGEEIKELYKLEVGNEVTTRMGDGGEGARKAKDVLEMIDEMNERIDSPERAERLGEYELKEVIREYSEVLNQQGLLSEAEVAQYEEKITKIIEQVGKIEKGRQDQQFKKVEKLEEEINQYTKILEDSNLSSQQRKSIEKKIGDLTVLNAETKEFLENVRNDHIEAATRYAELRESGASQKILINDFVDSQGNLDRKTTTSKERWKRIKTVADKWEIYEESSRTIMHPDQAREEAMREVISHTMTRLAKRGGRKAVTESDIREWAFGKVELMIKSGDEATGYATRQYISQISQIFAADRLDFNKELRRSGDLRTSTVLADNHCEVVTNESRDMIESMMAVAQFSNVYNHSQSAEDVVRASAALEMWHIGEMLKARGVSRGIKGKAGFYAVEVDENHKTVMSDEARIGGVDFRKPKTGFMKVYEKVVNGDSGQVRMLVGDKEYSMDKLGQMLDVGGDVNVRPAEIMNLMHQERFANQLLSIDGGIKERVREELVREAIKIELGLVDIDGNVNVEKLEGIVGGKVSFKVGGKVIDPNKMRLRMHLAVTELDGQAVDWDKGIKEKNFAEVAHPFGWAEKLAEGTWRFSGTSIGAWDKHHQGNSEDWNRKILHLVPYLSKFGVGTAYLRETCHTDFTDIFSQRGKELILGKMDKAVEFYDSRGIKKLEKRKEDLTSEELSQVKSGKKKLWSENEEEAKGLLNLLLTDKDGFLMARSRMIDLLNHYNSLKKEGKRGDADKFMKERLERLVVDKYGEREGKIKLNKAWEVIRKDEFAVEGKATGFEGYLEKVKEAYRFENFDWGITWNERIVKEYQYQVAADKYRGTLIAWLMKPNSTEAMITAIQTPAYYGEVSSTRKFKMMFEKHREYFTRAGATGLMYPVLGKDYNNEGFDKDPDAWDGVLNYQKERKALGFFAAREIGARPFLPSHFENLVTQAQRAKVLSFVEDAHELKNEILPLDLGKLMRKVDIGIEKAPWGVKQVLQATRFLTMGGDVPPMFLGKFITKRWGSVYFAGILGFIVKKMKEALADLNRHKWDIIEGTAKEGAGQIGDSLKN